MPCLIRPQVLKEVKAHLHLYPREPFRNTWNPNSHVLFSLLFALAHRYEPFVLVILHAGDMKHQIPVR